MMCEPKLNFVKVKDNSTIIVTIMFYMSQAKNNIEKLVLCGTHDPEWPD